MKKTFLKILPWGLSILPLLARAQTQQQGTSPIDQLCPPKDSKNYDPNSPCINISDKTHLLTLANNIIGFFRSLFWIVAVAMVIWAAYLYLTGGTNEANMKKARQVLTGAVIGMILALIATSVPFLIQSFLQ